MWKLNLTVMTSAVLNKVKKCKCKWTNFQQRFHTERGQELSKFSIGYEKSLKFCPQALTINHHAPIIMSNFIIWYCNLPKRKKQYSIRIYALCYYKHNSKSNDRLILSRPLFNFGHWYMWIIFKDFFSFF